MKRSILLSAVVIGAVLAVFAVTGTQALFTDSQTASGTVNAGTIDLYLSDVTGTDDTGADEAIFNAAAENLLPGESTSWTVKLVNAGTRDFNVTSNDATGSSGFECDAGHVGDEYSIAVLTPPTVPYLIAVGADQNVTIKVTLDTNAGNSCQGAAFNANVVFNVAQP